MDASAFFTWPNPLFATVEVGAWLTLGLGLRGHPWTRADTYWLLFGSPASAIASLGAHLPMYELLWVAWMALKLAQWHWRASPKASSDAPHKG